TAAPIGCCSACSSADAGFEVVSAATASIEGGFVRGDDGTEGSRTGRKVFADDETGFGPIVSWIEARDTDLQVEVTGVLAIDIAEAIGGVPNVTAACNDVEVVDVDCGRSLLQRISRGSNDTIVGQAAAQSEDFATDQWISVLAVSKRIGNYVSRR